MTVVSKRKKDGTGFGARLRALREAKGLTQEEVAERAGMAYQAIARIERGDADNPTWKTVQRLADALGVEPNDFQSEDGEQTPKKR